MLKKVTCLQDLNEVIRILTPNREKCLYLYCNVKKYGYENQHFQIYLNKENSVVIGIYFEESMHIYCEESISHEIWHMIEEQKPRTIFSSVQMELEGRYREEYTSLYLLKSLQNVQNPLQGICQLGKSEIGKLADFLYSYSGEYRRTYSREKLEVQLCERLADTYSRYFGLYQKEKLVGCAFTKAELSDLMIVGGILVAPDLRGQGFGRLLCQYKGVIAKNEGKEAYCFIDENNLTSIKLHTSIGYAKVGNIYKYTICFGGNKNAE